jgi:polysaccharide export outer membrane protein
MKQKIKYSLFSLCVLLLQVSCGINSNVLFKAPIGESASLDSLPINPNQEYRIDVDDKVIFSLSTNDGAKLLESLSGSIGGIESGASPEFVVRPDSTIEIPVLGKLKIAGMTIPETEDFLEKAFSKSYQNPFVQVKVTNQRVIIFPGEGSAAMVIPLVNRNTTLMEVIAQAGGVSERGKANTIKLMRKVNGVREIYVIDLSTIDGLKHADLIVQANDYIYIEPNPQLAREIIKEMAPIISLFSSFILIFTIFTTLK